MENVINVALQLTMENFEDQFATNIIVTEIETDKPSLVDNIKNVFNQYIKLNVRAIRGVK